MNLVRTFICIKVPDVVLDQLSRLQKQAIQFGQSVRWVRREGLHLTLKFLGDVEQSRLEILSKAVADSVREVACFYVKFSGCGAFPDFRHPRIYWIGIHEPARALFDLYERIENNVHKVGFAREKRAFTPHMTLGRVKGTDGLLHISEFLTGEKFETDEFTVDKIFIMKSELKPSGAEYTPLYTFQFSQKVEEHNNGR